MVRNVAREHRRHLARESASSPFYESGEHRPQEHILAVRAALDALSDTDREVILLSVYHGYTPREIGTILDTSSLVVRVRLHRARSRLKRTLLEGSVARRGLRPALESDHE